MVTMVRKNKQHEQLFSPEFNYNHKVAQVKKHKVVEKLQKKEVDEFLRTTEKGVYDHEGNLRYDSIGEIPEY